MATSRASDEPAQVSNQASAPMAVFFQSKTDEAFSAYSGIFRHDGMGFTGVFP
jgi:hypothetical protein